MDGPCCRLSDENLSVLLKMVVGGGGGGGWREEHRFPALDILRLKAARPASLPTKQQVSTGEEQSVLWLYTKLVFILGSEEIRAKNQ